MSFSKPCDKKEAFKASRYFKSNPFFLVATVLILQVADYAVVWLTDTGSSSSSSSNSWHQADVFVTLFALFYVGKQFAKTFQQPSSTDIKEAEENEVEVPKATYTQNASAKERSGTTKERRVSFNTHVEKKEYTSLADRSALRAEAPSFIPKAPKVVSPSAYVRRLNNVAKKDAESPSKDNDDDVGEVVFRSAWHRSADWDEPAKLEPAKTAPKPAPEQVVKSNRTAAYHHEAKAHSKWQVKEKVMWKSSHVVEAY